MKRAHTRALGTAPSALEVLQHALSDHQAGLSETDVDALLGQLGEHKRALQEAKREASMELLLHFLQSSRCVAWQGGTGRVGTGCGRAGCCLVRVLLLCRVRLQLQQSGGYFHTAADTMHTSSGVVADA